MTSVAEIPVTDKPAPVELITSDEFLDWLEPGVHADLIAGEIFMHSPVSLAHARLLNFVDCLLRLYIEEKKLGELFREVVAVKLGPRHTFLPDLCFFDNDQVKQMLPNHAPVAPKLVMEALSPTSESRDRRQKFSAYELFGVQEYWILDPERGLHQAYRRNGDFFVPYGSTTEDIIESEVVSGFYLRRSWLNAPESQNVMACLREILGAK